MDFGFNQELIIIDSYLKTNDTKSLKEYIKKKVSLTSGCLPETSAIEKLNESTATKYPTDKLNSCLSDLIKASDYFAKAGCYKKSNHCERQAKLIALQISLLPTGKNILALEQSELNDLIVNFEIFDDGDIIAEAYNYHLAWRDALFKNVILKGHSKYLHSYCKKYDLPSTLIEELVKLYKNYKTRHQLSLEENANLAKAMKTLLVKLDDVELKCRICSQLNFDDVKEELLQDQATQAHLRDLKLV